MTDTQLRDDVHAELTALLSAGGLASPTDELKGLLADGGFQQQMIAQYRADRPAPRKHRKAVVTAGPAGAGKSTYLNDLVGDGAGWFRVDADEVKSLVLTEALTRGLLAIVDGSRLADDGPVRPGELAGWVHAFSADTADALFRQSLAVGENVVMEGTLNWEPLPGIYAQLFTLHDYAQVDVLCVDAAKGRCIEQARGRWWVLRQQPGGLGGRFVPDEAISGLYPADAAHAVCVDRARELHDRLTAFGVSSVLTTC